VRRGSISSRYSIAITTAEQGETADERGPVEHQIEEEIAEIKRYEVRFSQGLHQIRNLIWDYLLT
jgi:hypothetical protein